MSQKLQTNDGQPAVQSATFCLSLLIGLLAVASPGLSSFFPPPAVFGWGCPPCNRSHCPPTTCDESLQHADECGCCALCGKLEEEACGGQGNAGGSCNGSGLHCAYRLGSIFGEEGFGICEKSLCQRRLCGYRQRCKVVVGDDGRDSTLCSCDHFLCDHKCNPVCGRDDKTYSSICHLQLAECLSGRPIGIRHFSQCKVVCPPKPKKVYSNLYSAPTPIYCIHEEEMYSPFHILPPTSRNPCTYHVCSGYGHMEQYPVPGCEGTPPEEDWKVEEAVIPASWTEWSPYSSCVGNCEKGGWANRTRTCTAPPPSSHVEAEASAVYCQGEAEESKLCEPEGCRICHITQWSQWSECSTLEPCQQGWRTRERTITNVPTVPELCGPTIENRTCQFIGPCTTCDTRQTGWFDIRDKHTGCFNRRPERGVVCAGTCEPGSCCSAVFDKEDQSTAMYFMMDCPDPKVKPYSLRFFLPVDCECVDCNSTVRAPNFFGPRWRIIFRP